MATTAIPARPSIHTLGKEYRAGKKERLEKLMRAWKQMKGLHHEDKRSFFTIGGYHGAPLIYRSDVEKLNPEDAYVYWGGYCHHGNVLFPTWHRAYCLQIEKALQHFEPDVMLPYWDETSTDTIKGGIPWPLTEPTFELDGECIPNPLRSFVLPVAVTDELSDDQYYGGDLWAKPKNYETVRYPLSGLEGSKEAREDTAKHNAKFPDPLENIRLLNKNVKTWLFVDNPTPDNPPDNPEDYYGVIAQYIHCLRAPNYTVFSNTTSTAAWNRGVSPGQRESVESLEAPHNDIHLAVGGFDVPGLGQVGLIEGANGDMGENNTAAFDPIFFFHHCNVDRVFWIWQKQHNQTKELSIIPGYPGTNSSDLQGPTPGTQPGQRLSLTTPLEPFIKNLFGEFYTSEDVVNIESQLGYTYEPGSLDTPSPPPPPPLRTGYSTKTLSLEGIDRTGISGSFVISAFADIPMPDGTTKTVFLGFKSVLSRGNVVRCANCRNNLEVTANFPLNKLLEDEVERAKFRVEFKGRKNMDANISYKLKIV